MPFLKVQIKLVVIFSFCVVIYSCALEETDDSSLDATPSTTATTVLKAEDEDNDKNILLNRKSESEIYGKTNAEQLGDLSVIDVLFRKRQLQGCGEVGDKSNEHSTDINADELQAKPDEPQAKPDEPQAKVDDSIVSVEEVELVSLEEEVTTGKTEEEEEGKQVGLNDSPVTDYLIPPAKDANCTNFEKDLNSDKAGDEQTETTDVDPLQHE